MKLLKTETTLEKARIHICSSASLKRFFILLLRYFHINQLNMYEESKWLHAAQLQGWTSFLLFCHLLWLMGMLLLYAI